MRGISFSKPKNFYVMSEKTLAIFGAGSLGRQIAHLNALNQDFDRVIYYDDDLFGRDPQVKGTLCTGPMDYRLGRFDEALVGVGYRDMEFRADLFEMLAFDRIPMSPMIHPSTLLDPTLELGEGSILGAQVLTHEDSVLYDNVFVHGGTILSHGAQIGSHTFIGPGCVIAGNVRIGDRCFIGAGTVIRDHVYIESRVKIGAGSLVTRDLTIKGWYWGSPAVYQRALE
jgi:sugar O-acyltransferase (sialic acid O-acetyltransferase NeuD family)